MSASCVVHAATLRGVQAVPVEVEVCVSNGMPGFSVVGRAGIAGARAGCVASLRFQHAEQQSGGEPCAERAA